MGSLVTGLHLFRVYESLESNVSHVAADVTRSRINGDIIFALLLQTVESSRTLDIYIIWWMSCAWARASVKHKHTLKTFFLIPSKEKHKTVMPCSVAKRFHHAVSCKKQIALKVINNPVCVCTWTQFALHFKRFVLSSGNSSSNRSRTTLAFARSNSKALCIDESGNLSLVATFVDRRRSTTDCACNICQLKRCRLCLHAINVAMTGTLIGRPAMRWKSLSESPRLSSRPAVSQE